MEAWTSWTACLSYDAQETCYSKTRKVAISAETAETAKAVAKLHDDDRWHTTTDGEKEQQQQ